MVVCFLVSLFPCLCDCLFVCLLVWVVCLFVCVFVFVCWFVCAFVCLCVCLFVWFVCLFCLFCLFVLLVCFVCLSVCLFVWLVGRSVGRSFVRSMVCLFLLFVYGVSERCPVPSANVLQLSWPGFLKQLRDTEKMLARKITREQFVARCCVATADAQIFKSWSAKIAGLRWEVITKYCAEESWPALW